MRQLGSFGAALIATLLLCGHAFSQTSNPVEDQITRALQPKAPAGGATRGMTSADPNSQELQRLLTGVRTRSMIIEPKRRGHEDIEVAREERDKIADLARGRPKIDLEIYFDYDSWEIRERAMPTLAALGKVLSRPEFRNTVFLIDGYTDARGRAEYNQVLSERRAQSVRHLLIEEFRLPPDALIPMGFGKERLKFPDHPFAEKNRRVQIVNTEMKADRGER